MSSRVYVGTSGWVYSDWKGAFYPQDLPQKKWLEYYSQHFKTVEVNSTFYHQMKPATFENWAKSVPEEFTFALKGSRFITHIKRLKPDRISVESFIESSKCLGDKLGPVLWQLPPRFKADEKRLEALLVQSSTRPRPSRDEVGKFKVKSGKSAMLAFEFRDPSWFDGSIYQVLRKYNAALVIAESGGHWPCEEVITADFTYIRFHGEGGSYATSYTADELKIWAKKIKKWQKAGIDVYAYFNNDVGGFAVDNAKMLIDLIR
ncbi:hypothetical protein A2W70_00455 [Candidatus Curtissbacteria bacterium RIFCSPLOWO2_02_41_11]|uniref:DUF72 domain-containing protein n=2 Tax=Candidatus Curtissiibacteriota TaxID=1752717 RepID=A0A1F5HPN5_9BACT|nr:MAG: hypothetical protein UU56_C0017G0041 [Candidatus Curtissbacteria bacterium GW2011_GWA2_41_24]OGD89655.1 MAG: hypothetical protein A2Z54_00455 [Candidatus Curtissbacteria bacterium RIFCSPHIGHO2_02_39_8]OGE06015.1 MAG: hypothetical protein A2W70_00455 [Candidatus Curtissbacteria bacterium RIFCSPLOWO2_02_41_11]